MPDNQQPGLGSLMATSITGQALGGAMAVAWLAYHPVISTSASISPQSLENALTIIFSTGVSLCAMILHIVGNILWQKYLITKT